MGDRGNISNGSSPPSSPPPFTDKLPQELINAMQALFGKHPGFRTTHAKGLLVEGLFTPTPEAKNLSVAAHFSNPSTPVIARFSVGGGIPKIADVDDRATPKGLAVRFQISDDVSTDLVAHTFNGFATRDGEDFLTFLQLFRAVGVAKALLKKAQDENKDASAEQAALDKANQFFGAFLAKHKSAAEFANGPKPNPRSYATIAYYEPNTHVLVNAEGRETNVRYRLTPAEGEQLYEAGELPALAESYLEDDLRQRFPEKPIVFTIQAHIADPDDVLDDATVPYKGENFVDVGRLEINKVADDNDERQQKIAFSPMPEKGGIQGIRSSDDPLIQTRKGVYWISADQRRNETRKESSWQ